MGPINLKHIPQVINNDFGRFDLIYVDLSYAIYYSKNYGVIQLRHSDSGRSTKEADVSLYMLYSNDEKSNYLWKKLIILSTPYHFCDRTPTHRLEDGKIKMLISDDNDRCPICGKMFKDIKVYPVFKYLYKYLNITKPFNNDFETTTTGISYFMENYIENSFQYMLYDMLGKGERLDYSYVCKCSYISLLENFNRAKWDIFILILLSSYYKKKYSINANKLYDTARKKLDDMDRKYVWYLIMERNSKIEYYETDSNDFKAKIKGLRFKENLSRQNPRQSTTLNIKDYLVSKNWVTYKDRKYDIGVLQCTNSNNDFGHCYEIVIRGEEINGVGFDNVIDIKEVKFITNNIIFNKDITDRLIGEYVKANEDDILNGYLSFNIKLFENGSYLILTTYPFNKFSYAQPSIVYCPTLYRDLHNMHENEYVGCLEIIYKPFYSFKDYIDYVINYVVHKKCEKCGEGIESIYMRCSKCNNDPLCDREEITKLKYYNYYKELFKITDEMINNDEMFMVIINK